MRHLIQYATTVAAIAFLGQASLARSPELVVTKIDVGSVTKTGSTTEYFSPKVSVESMRFLFAENGEYFCELDTPQSMLFEGLIPLPYKDYNVEATMKNPVAPESGKWVLDRIPESIGDSYTLFFPDSFTFESSAFAGVCPSLANHSDSCMHPGF